MSAHPHPLAGPVRPDDARGTIDRAARGVNRTVQTVREVCNRVLGSALAAFSLVTATCISWAFMTPGDRLGYGDTAFLLSFGLALGFGVVTGFRASRRSRTLVLAAALLSVSFWMFVPDRWWLDSPPPDSQPAATGASVFA